MKKHFIFLSLISIFLAIVFFLLKINFLANLFSLLTILVLITGILFLSKRSFRDLKKNKTSIKKILVRNRFFSKLGLTFLVGLISLILYLFSLEREFNIKVDLSENALYTLSPLTLETLKQIDKPVNIDLYAFKNEASEIENFVKLYTEKNPLISFTRKNLGESFIEVNENNIISSGTLLISLAPQRQTSKEGAARTAREAKKIKILPEQIIKNQALTSTANLANVVVAYERVLNASLKSLFNPAQKVYFLSSLNKEKLADLSLFKESLAIIGFALVEISNLDNTNLAGDDILIIFDLNLKFKIADITKITNHIKKGGRIFYLSEPILDSPNKDDLNHLPEAFNLNLRLLNSLGVRIDYGEVVIDNENYYSDYFNTLGIQKKGNPLVPLYEYKEEENKTTKTYHPVIDPLANENWDVIFKTVIPLKYSNSNQWGITLTPIIESKTTAWGEKNLAQEIRDQNLGYNSGVDEKPPLVFALAGENKQSGFKAIFLGDIDIVRNDSIREGVNETFIQNILFWLNDEQELISEGFKKTNSLRKVFTTEEQFFFILVFLLGIPITLFLFFITFYNRRKNKTL